MRRTSLRPAFVQYVPEIVEEGVLYVSLENRTAVHKCCCGCGSEVVTPLDPTQWKFIYDGRASLDPSVGSWNLKCRSHYWIRQNGVHWAGPLSDDRIAAARTAQRQSTTEHYASALRSPTASTGPAATPPTSLWARLWHWLKR